MYAPILGTLTCAEGRGCSKCGQRDEPNVFAVLLHDFRCRGWRTAFYNLRIRLMPPAWFADAA